MLDFLTEYRKENCEQEKKIIQEKWKKTLTIIKEAFSDELVNKSEALRVIKNEFTIDPPKNIDSKFLSENLDYILEKVQGLNEGQIKIVINNSPKEKTVKEKEVDSFEIDEAKKGKKAKKDKEESDEEIIIDEPKDKLDVSTIEADELKVTISYDAESKMLSVIEGDETIEELEVLEPETLKDICEFLKNFYTTHDYIIDEIGLEDVEGTKEHEENETSDEEKIEDSSEELSDIPLEVEEESVTVESKSWGFADILSENFEALREDEKIAELPKIETMVGRACEYKGKWYTIKEVSDNGMMVGMDVDGQDTPIPLKDITDFEKDILKKTESVEPEGDVVEESVSAKATGLIRQWMSKRKKKSASGKSGPLPSAIDKKKDVKNQPLTRKPMKKTGQKIPSIKLQKLEKRAESNKALTKTPMKSTGQKIPSINKIPILKKDIKSQGLTHSPTKNPGNKIPTVKALTITKKDVSSDAMSKKVGMKPEKKETVKIPHVM
jgi:hypothetical protein